MMGTFKKPVHELCVDKTSCGDKGGFTPASHLTKDHIRKSYKGTPDKPTEKDF